MDPFLFWCFVLCIILLGSGCFWLTCQIQSFSERIDRLDRDAASRITIDVADMTDSGKVKVVTQLLTRN